MIHSISSQICSAITTARNPQGKEENWLLKNGEQTQPSSKVKFTANVAYSLNTVVSLIETAVAGTFTFLSIPLQLISSKPYEKASQWLESSAFSMIWSIGCIAARNLPNLLTREESARNIVFRGGVYNDPVEIPQAPLSSRLFMIPRELPSYLSTAYSLRFKNIKPEHGFFARMKGKISRYQQLIKEINQMQGTQAIFDRNIRRLDTDFEKLNKELDKTKRAVCAYFVSSKDHNGAILGDHLYYYHHYKINKFKKHFDVSAKVVRNTKEMFDHLKHLKATYPNRPIKVIDIVAHGDPKSIVIDHVNSDKTIECYEPKHIGKNEFSTYAPGADLIFDACSTGIGTDSIAEVIAKNNPGIKVFAPGSTLFFSKPIFKTKGNNTTVSDVTHGFALVNAYTSRKFQSCAFS